MVRALLLDGFGTVLDWARPFAEVNENALRRAHAEAESVVRIAPFPDFHTAWRELRAAEHAEKDARHEEMDHPRRFVAALERVGAGKRQVRVLGPRMYQRYVDELAAQMRLAPDALDLFRALPDDVKLALVSNYGDGTTLRTALDRLNVFYRFDAIVVSGDPEVRVRKPHARVFENALADLDVDAADALVIGDDVTCDVDGAHAAGIRAALVANPRGGLIARRDGPVPEHVPHAVAVLPSLRDVPALLEKLA